MNDLVGIDLVYINPYKRKGKFIIPSKFSHLRWFKLSQNQFAVARPPDVDAEEFREAGILTDPMYIIGSLEYPCNLTELLIV